MRLPQAFQMEVIRTHAIRAKASGTMGDAATLIDYVSKVFQLPYDKAATVTMRKYGIRYAEKAYAGRQSGFTLKDPSKDAGVVGYDKEVVVSVVDYSLTAAIQAVDLHL